MVSVLLTAKCNMNCVYCITSSNFLNNGEMDINMAFAKQGIKDYFEQTKYHYLRFVALGEPTQNFGAMKELYAYAKDLTNGKVEFEYNIFAKGNAYFISQSEVCDMKYAWDEIKKKGAIDRVVDFIY